jgi:hypothetical protein
MSTDRMYIVTILGELICPGKITRSENEELSRCVWTVSVAVGDIACTSLQPHHSRTR